MTTYYKDFPRFLDAEEYSLKRGTLGHNVRRMPYSDAAGKPPGYRVYFASHRIDYAHAIDVMTVPNE